MRRLVTFFLLFPVVALTIFATERPNVILIISDDHAFSDYGFMGSERANTPVLDKLAEESLTYTRGYVMPVCSPTLASLLTGKLPHAHGITGNDLSDKRSPYGTRKAIAERLLDNSLLLPKALTEAGYLTFQTGKLWNGTYEEMGFTHGMTRKGSRHGDEGLKIGRESMQPIFDFIEQAEEAEKPFFIWHAPFLPHTPHNPPERLLKKYRGKGPNATAEKYYAMVEWLDETTGELEDYLVANDLKENTVVLYLADNGWDALHDMWGNHRAKLSPYEKGIRTPMMLRWPGKVAPEMDTVTLAHVTDFPKTILDITGAKQPDDLPGLNLMDREAMKARKTVFVEAYTHDIADLDDPAQSLFAYAVIHGWWKLLIPGPVKPDRSFATAPDGVELYNLKADPLETQNLEAQHPEVVEQLKKRQMEHWDPSPACCGSKK
jgi:uncharacterized sulfatase